MNIIPNILLMLATAIITPVNKESAIMYDANVETPLQVQANSTCNGSALSKQDLANTQTYQTQVKSEKSIANLQAKEITIIKANTIEPQDIDSERFIEKFYSYFPSIVQLQFNSNFNDKPTANQDRLQFDNVFNSLSKNHKLETNTYEINAFEKNNNLGASYTIFNQLNTQNILVFDKNGNDIANELQYLSHNSSLLDNYKIGAMNITAPNTAFSSLNKNNELKTNTYNIQSFLGNDAIDTHIANFNTIDKPDLIRFNKNNIANVNELQYLDYNNKYFGYVNANAQAILQYNNEWNIPKAIIANSQTFESKINSVDNISNTIFDNIGICKFELAKNNMLNDFSFNTLFSTDTTTFNAALGNKYDTIYALIYNAENFNGYNSLSNIKLYSSNLLQQPYTQIQLTNYNIDNYSMQQICTNSAIVANKSEAAQEKLQQLTHNIPMYVSIAKKQVYNKRSRFDNFSGEYGSMVWYLVRIGKQAEDEGNIEKADKYYDELLNITMENTNRKYIPIH